MQFRKAIIGDVIITPSHNNGFIVKVGCGIFIFESVAQMCSELANYLNNPNEYQKEYEQKFGIRPMTANINGNQPNTAQS